MDSSNDKIKSNDSSDIKSHLKPYLTTTINKERQSRLMAKIEGTEPRKDHWLHNYDHIDFEEEMAIFGIYGFEKGKNRRAVYRRKSDGEFLILPNNDQKITGIQDLKIRDKKSNNLDIIEKTIKRK